MRACVDACVQAQCAVLPGVSLGVACAVSHNPPAVEWRVAGQLGEACSSGDDDMQGKAPIWGSLIGPFAIAMLGCGAPLETANQSCLAVVQCTHEMGPPVWRPKWVPISRVSPGWWCSE